MEFNDYLYTKVILPHTELHNESSTYVRHSYNIPRKEANNIKEININRFPSNVKIFNAGNVKLTLEENRYRELEITHTDISEVNFNTKEGCLYLNPNTTILNPNHLTNNRSIGVLIRESNNLRACSICGHITSIDDDLVHLCARAAFRLVEAAYEYEKKSPITLT